MRFEWDPAKSAWTFAQRGFDFSFAVLVFESRFSIKRDLRREYGEERWLAYGAAHDRPLVVVFTDRELPDGSFVRRIISARLMNSKERRSYAQDTETHQA